MIDFANLRGQWEKTLRVERGYTLVDIELPECYVGYDEQLRRTLLILNDVESKIPPSSRSVEIRQRRRRDGKFSLTLTLLCEEESAVFTEMCRDLLTFAEEAQDESSALKKFWQRYAHWQKLFAAATNDLLSDERQRGLIGELIFLREQLQRGREPLEAVEGWVGPLKEPQDFSYGEMWHEIKTVMEQAEKIRVASLEQLSLARRGELVVYRLAKTSIADGFTLNSLVKNLSELLAKKLVAAEKFKALLFAAGYVRRAEYGEKFYRLAETMRFAVDENFPRLTRDNLPPAIVEASYSLSLRGLKEVESNGR